MAIMALIQIGLAAFCVPGVILLALGIARAVRKKKKGVLFAGIALCAPLVLFYAAAALGALLGIAGL